MKKENQKINLVKDMLSMIGDNPNRNGLKDTSQRVVKM